MPTTITFTTAAELFCVIGAWIDMPVAQVLPHLPSIEVKRRENHITLVFRDPLDALLGAHHVGRELGERFVVMSGFASALACEMLREPTPIARDAITWLTGNEDVQRGFLVAVTEKGLREYETPEVIAEAHGHAKHALVVAVVGLGPPRVVTLTQPGWVGRSRDASIQIPDDLISRRHVELGVDSHDGWFVRDAGSVNGYFLANKKAGSARHILHPGMTIQFSDPFGVVVLVS
ncbi:MAG: FHA domain-containing protein [Kofleriaceae bacterium]